MPYLNKSCRLTARSEHVTIIQKRHETVWLVENDRGVIHSVRPDIVQDDMVVDVVVEIIEEPNLFNMI